MRTAPPTATLQTFLRIIQATATPHKVLPRSQAVRLLFHALILSSSARPRTRPTFFWNCGAAVPSVRCSQHPKPSTRQHCRRPLRGQLLLSQARRRLRQEPSTIFGSEAFPNRPSRFPARRERSTGDICKQGRVHTAEDRRIATSDGFQTPTTPANP